MGKKRNKMLFTRNEHIEHEVLYDCKLHICVNACVEKSE